MLADLGRPLCRAVLACAADQAVWAGCGTSVVSGPGRVGSAAKGWFFTPQSVHVGGITCLALRVAVVGHIDVQGAVTFSVMGLIDCTRVCLPWVRLHAPTALECCVCVCVSVCCGEQLTGWRT